MTVIWIALLIELMLAHLAYIFMPSEAILITVIGLNLLIAFIVMISKARLIAFPLITGFILRIALAAFDSLTLILSQTNGDTFGYLSNAFQWAVGVPRNKYGGLYSQLLGYIFRFCGGSRFFAEYINVLLGVTIIWIVYKCLDLMSVDIKRKKLYLWIIAVFPYSVFSASVSYRETIIATMVVASLYCALQWYFDRHYYRIIGCTICLLFAAAFHAGVLFVGVGYIFLFTFYSHEWKRFQFNRRTIPIAILLLIGALVVFAYSNIFLGKFSNMTAERTLNQFNYSSGGSAYLGWIDATSIGQIILFSPLKYIHFLFSPLPLYWRSFIDFMTFAVDSMTYFLCITFVVKHRKTSRYFPLISAVLLGLFFCSFVFGIGTWTAGTAVRHRQKLFACLLIVAAAASVRNEDCRLIQDT